MKITECFETYQKTYLRISEILRGISSDFIPDKVLLGWEKGGLLTPGWNESLGLNRLWLNVVAHNAATGRCAYAMSLALQQHLTREMTSVHDVVAAALVHDSFKRREFEMNEVAKASGRTDLLNANREAEHASVNFLRAMGFSDAIVIMAGTTGDLGLDRLLAGESVTLGQKIVFYADCCVSGDTIVGYTKRFDDLMPHFKHGGRYEMLGKAFQEKHGRTHRQVYDDVCLPLQCELVNLLPEKLKGDPSIIPR